MIGFLKVSAGVAFLMTIVLVPVLIGSFVLLYFTQKGSGEEIPKRPYITLSSYQESKENPNQSAPTGETFIDCETNQSLCEEVIVSLDSSTKEECFEGRPESIYVDGYFKESLHRFVSSQCEGYKSLEKIFEQSLKEQ